MKIALLSTSDTDLLSARASGADYVWANPARPGHEGMAARLERPSGFETLAGARSSTSDTTPLASLAARPPRPRVGVLFYRAHHASGNTDFAHAMADAIDATGQAVGVPIFSSSLRSAPDDLY